MRTKLLSSSVDIVTAVAGGLLMIKGARMLHKLNCELPFYKDYVSIFIGSIGALSLWNGAHGIACRAGLQKSKFCSM